MTFLWHNEGWLSGLAYGLIGKNFVEPATNLAFDGIKSIIDFVFESIGEYVYADMQKQFDETVNNVDMCPPDTL